MVSMVYRAVQCSAAQEPTHLFFCFKHETSSSDFAFFSFVHCCTPNSSFQARMLARSLWPADRIKLRLFHPFFLRLLLLLFPFWYPPPSTTLTVTYRRRVAGWSYDRPSVQPPACLALPRVSMEVVAPSNEIKLWAPGPAFLPVAGKVKSTRVFREKSVGLFPPAWVLNFSSECECEAIKPTAIQRK